MSNMLIYTIIAVVGTILLTVFTTSLALLIKRLRHVEDLPITFDEYLKQHMLPEGVYIICGRQRSGKGSLGCAIMDVDATYHGGERYQLAQEFVDGLNDDYGYDLKLPEHLYYSKNKMYLTPDYAETHHVDVLDVALPETAEDMHFPPYAMFSLEELDGVMNARTWKSAPEKKANVIDGYKWGGHQNLTIMGDAQSFGRLDIAIRSLATDIFYIINRKDFYSDDIPHRWWEFRKRREPNHVVKTEWEFLWIKNQLYQEAVALSQYGDFINRDDCIKKCKFVYDGNIYERYNSKSGQAYWYKNIKNFACATHPADSLSPEAVDDYCLRNARRVENATADTEK